MFWENKAQIDVDSVCYIFDKVTAYNAKNIIHKKGWKTNKAARLNHKIILPIRDKDGFTDYRVQELIQDIDKVCCLLSGINPKDMKKATVSNVHKPKYKETPTNGIWELDTDERESDFFTIKVYKMGTVHLTFKDKKICEAINQIVAKDRNWIGSDY